MSIEIKLQGTDQLIKLIREAMLNHSVNDVRKALTRGANVIVDEAKMRAPGSDRNHSYTNAAGQKVTIRPGNLRRSIQILPKWNKDPAGIYVGPKISKNKRNPLDPYYAHFAEYGTAPHSLSFKGKFVSGKGFKGGKGGADHPGARPQPYMRPAHDTKKNEALNIAMDDVAKMIIDSVSSKWW